MAVGQDLGGMAHTPHIDTCSPSKLPLMTTAPILLFVYNRPAHTQRVVASLLQNAEAAQSHLFIYSDAAKTPADNEAVNEVR